MRKLISRSLSTLVFIGYLLSSNLYASSEVSIASPAPVSIFNVEVKYNDELDEFELTGVVTNISNVVLYQTYIGFDLLKDDMWVGEINYKIQKSIKPNQKVFFIRTLPPMEITPNGFSINETLATYYLDYQHW
nr:hypothetical protein [Providencia rustigianii]